jgi:hypothetical protein
VAKNVLDKINRKWEEEGDKIRMERFKKLNHVNNWRNSARGQERREILKQKYCDKTLLGLKTQREIYWLTIDQIIPPALVFRDELEWKYGVNWMEIDRTKIFLDSRMQAFQWRLTHGKLYARKYLLRFKYIQEQNCTQCDAPVQTVKHVFNQCPRNMILFANFKRQYELEFKLSNWDRLIGFDTNIKRTRLQMKKLNILRKCMYDAVHAEAVLRWEDVLKSVENMYIIEYAIADKSGCILKHLKNWEL